MMMMMMMMMKGTITREEEELCNETRAGVPVENELSAFC
jgi:hypothetical protein